LIAFCTGHPRIQCPTRINRSPRTLLRLGFHYGCPPSGLHCRTKSFSPHRGRWAALHNPLTGVVSLGCDQFLWTAIVVGPNLNNFFAIRAHQKPINPRLGGRETVDGTARHRGNRKPGHICQPKKNLHNAEPLEPFGWLLLCCPCEAPTSPAPMIKSRRGDRTYRSSRFGVPTEDTTSHTVSTSFSLRFA